jgi:hypothetical protein
VAVARRGGDNKTLSPQELNGIVQNKHIRHEFWSEQKQGAAHGVAKAQAYPATGQFSLLESAVKNNVAPTACIAAIEKNRLSIAGPII